jgi:hypothetical protein
VAEFYAGVEGGHGVAYNSDGDWGWRCAPLIRPFGAPSPTRGEG